MALVLPLIHNTTLARHVNRVYTLTHVSDPLQAVARDEPFLACPDAACTSDHN